MPTLAATPGLKMTSAASSRIFVFSFAFSSRIRFSLKSFISFTNSRCGSTSIRGLLSIAITSPAISESFFIAEMPLLPSPTTTPFYL